MPFTIERNDITKMRTDAVVNTANPRAAYGRGTDFGIYRAAGRGLMDARRALGAIEEGHAVMTAGYDLPARHVIHTVGPCWKDGMSGERDILSACYRNALILARDSGCSSVAFPLISAGTNGFPPEIALKTAMDAVRDFLRDSDMMVHLVVFDRRSFAISKDLMEDVSSYIDDHYANMTLAMESCEAEMAEYDASVMRRSSISKRASLEELLERKGKTFSEVLLEKIDASGMTDPEVYKKANVSRKLFSKIKNNRDYRPGKVTAVAFAIALRMDMDEASDFIATAGYAFTDSSRFDIIVRYFIENGNYDMYELNSVLFRFDEPLIGV